MELRNDHGTAVQRPQHLPLLTLHTHESAWEQQDWVGMPFPLGMIALQGPTTGPVHDFGSHRMLTLYSEPREMRLTIFLAHQGTPPLFTGEWETTPRQITSNFAPSRRHSYPHTRRLLRWNAATATTLFVVTSGLAVAGWDQAAYIAMLGGLGFSSLAATMGFRLLRLRRSSPGH